MWKELYQKALQLLHQPVVIQHINGWVYHGLLIRVTKKGVYLWPFGHAVPVSGTMDVNVRTAEATDADRQDVQPVYVGPLFFPFAVIASFAAGSLFGSAVSRPPYPYYYPPYGPYGGYPW
ncbi:MAG: hypothetical protein IRZ10_09305 [Thermoflavifilum sp.]|nr:hypothetical protein [Thermoflavifilum sp.]MCL6514607.1 hypothetical protein [Alicyclobacillus sp.]